MHCRPRRTGHCGANGSGWSVVPPMWQRRGSSKLARRDIAEFFAVLKSRYDSPMRGRGTVLIVEDDGDLRGMFRIPLTLDGFTVEEAADGLSALAYLDTHKPDAVVLDLGLPGFSRRNRVERNQNADEHLRDPGGRGQRPRQAGRRRTRLFSQKTCAGVQGWQFMPGAAGASTSDLHLLSKAEQGAGSVGLPRARRQCSRPCRPS